MPHSAFRASPRSLLFNYKFLRHFWASSEVFTPFQPVCGELSTNSPAHECQYLRDKPRGWFSTDKCTVPSPGKLLCQEKGTLIFERLNSISLWKTKSQCFKPILGNPSAPFLLRNISNPHIPLPSQIHSLPSRQAGVGEARAHNFKQNPWASGKAWKWLCSCPGGGDLLLTPLVDFMVREIKQVGSGVNCQAGIQLGDYGTKKPGIGLCLGLVSQKCTAKAVSGVLLTMELKQLLGYICKLLKECKKLI